MGNNRQQIVAIDWVKWLKEAKQEYLEYTRLQDT